MVIRRESQLGSIGSGVEKMGRDVEGMKSGIEKKTGRARERLSPRSRPSLSGPVQTGEISVYDEKGTGISYGSDSAVLPRKIREKILRMPREQKRTIARWYGGQKKLTELGNKLFPNYLGDKEKYYLSKKESRERYLGMLSKDSAMAKRGTPGWVKERRLREALTKSGILLKRKNWR